MDQLSSEPTTPSTDVYDFDGSVVVKQEPQNDFSQMDAMDNCGLNEKVINIAPIIDNEAEICNIEEIHSIKQEPDNKWCESSEASLQPSVICETVKSENEVNVCDGNQDLKLTNRNVSLKNEGIQTDDSTSQLVEVSGAIDCKDDIIGNVTPGISVGRVNQSDAAQQKLPCHLESTDEIKREGM